MHAHTWCFHSQTKQKLQAYEILNEDSGIYKGNFLEERVIQKFTLENITFFH